MLKKIYILFLAFFFNSCFSYKIPKNKAGLRILPESIDYRLNEIPNAETLKKIDTSAYYVQVFEGRYYNESEMKRRSVLKFHSDGYFKSMLLPYQNENTNKIKRSIGYGGKYKIEKNVITLERFLPIKGGKTNYFVRSFISGKIESDKIILGDKNHMLITVYEKKHTLD